jgi:hypothetical protein
MTRGRPWRGGHVATSHTHTVFDVASRRPMCFRPNCKPAVHTACRCDQAVAPLETLGPARPTIGPFPPKLSEPSLVVWASATSGSSSINSSWAQPVLFQRADASVFSSGLKVIDGMVVAARGHTQRLEFQIRRAESFHPNLLSL